MPHYGVSNYAMPNLVPCVVVGFERVDSRDARLAPLDVMTIDVQCGGYSCLQESATGFVLRLAAATEFARCDPWPLVRAFQDASDDRTWTEGPSDPDGIVSGTSGESFSTETLREL